MRRLVPGLTLLALVVLVVSPVVAAERSFLVDTTWLRQRLGDRDLRIVDMSEAAAYAQGHVPGAVHLDLEDVRIVLPAGGTRIPTDADARRLFRRLAIGADTTVVAYDDAAGLNAAWLFYVLDMFGHRRVAVLDGGASRWRATGGPWTREPPAPVPVGVVATPAVQPDRAVTAEWVRERLHRPDLVIVDARSPAEYLGRDVRALRGGHIPGAVNVEWRRHLRPDGTFRPVGELRQLYASQGVTPDKTVVTYCQTHHRAAQTYFVLRMLGYPRLAAYPGSWADWGNRTDLPVDR